VKNTILLGLLSAHLDAAREEAREAADRLYDGRKQARPPPPRPRPRPPPCPTGPGMVMLLGGGEGGGDCCHATVR